MRVWCGWLRDNYNDTRETTSCLPQLRRPSMDISCLQRSLECGRQISCAWAGAYSSYRVLSALENQCNWYGFTTAADRRWLSSFLRRSVKLGYTATPVRRLLITCVKELMNNCFSLFGIIINNTQHEHHIVLLSTPTTGAALWTRTLSTEA